MEIFVFSNTKFLDFHILSETGNSEINRYCKDLIYDKEFVKLETSPFVLFQRFVGKRRLVGASLHVNQLGELSSRYFVVDRANGKTPTKCLVVVLLEDNQNIYLTEELLVEILRKVYNMKWLETRYTNPLKLKFEVKQEIEGKIKQSRFFKNVCDNQLELFYKINVVLYHQNKKP